MGAVVLVTQLAAEGWGRRGRAMQRWTAMMAALARPERANKRDSTFQTAMYKWKQFIIETRWYKLDKYVPCISTSTKRPLK
uniref:Uncharacterized protein n=1 Tax=Oryza glumipatula TaxID=40148 RepID=A0A0D9YDA1_9ORYZ